uniref:Dolichyl-diphosphooligosaccharide--protein glycosyltransferase 48 kDa subunit n=1 Tax=Globodera pallida TaxID=36090 RepID=A0A183BR59_GLOPA
MPFWMHLISHRHTFRRPATQHCEQIEPISASTQLREFVGYEMASNGGDLIVQTNFSGGADGEKAEEADAYVQLTAIAIPEAKKADNSTVRFKTFNTKKEGEQYVLDNMEPGKLYAVQYTYGKQSPFVYEESRRFLLDMASGMTPVHVQYNLTEPYSEQPGVAATARLDPKFNQYELGIDVEPLCEPNESTLHFWLTKDRPEKELHELRLLDALCTAMPQHSVCHRAPGSSSAAAAAAGDAHRCAMPDAKLCYTSNIVVHEKVCVCVTDSFLANCQ